MQSLLSARGYFYLVALKDNNIPRIFSVMKDKYGLRGEVSETWQEPFLPHITFKGRDSKACWTGALIRSSFRPIIVNPYFQAHRSDVNLIPTKLDGIWLSDEVAK